MPNKLEALVERIARALFPKNGHYAPHDGLYVNWDGAQEYIQESYLEQAKTVLSILSPTTLSALPGLEAGTMVAVPVEPTEAMIMAGTDAAANHPEWANYTIAKATYKAMLLAASKEQLR